MDIQLTLVFALLVDNRSKQRRSETMGDQLLRRQACADDNREWVRQPGWRGVG